MNTQTSIEPVIEFNPQEITQQINKVKLDFVPDKHPDGRYCGYTDDFLPYIEQLAQHGLNNKQIAACLGIKENAFYDWWKKFPQFAHSIKKYRGVADIQVENALFKSALGYSYLEKKKERKKTENGYEMVLTEVIKKDVQASPAAQIFYLKNRMSHRYKDKIETVHSLDNALESMAFVIKRREE